MLAVALSSCPGNPGEGLLFAVESLDVEEGAVWPLNRPMRIAFTQAVDFSSVSLNTIQVRALDGGAVPGEFRLESPSVVVFQPRCPLLADASDAGLQPGGVEYELRVLGSAHDEPSCVQSAAGGTLEHGVVRRFRTVDSTLALELFHDAQPGPPRPVVRSPSPADQNPDACHVELGGDPAQRVWFRFDEHGIGALDPLAELPLNRYSAGAERVALMLYFDQAVEPLSENVSPQRLSWQYDAAPAGAAPQWTDLLTEVELVANCTSFGAVVRIEPQGLLPEHTGLRVRIAPQFSDLTGQSGLQAQDGFARADSAPAPAARVDEFLEGFESDAGLDLAEAFADPPALVEGGLLSASLAFPGTGGPEGTFDWRVAPGQVLFFNTDSQTIAGGPGFVAQHQVLVLGGTVDVRNLRVEAGGTLKVQGTQRMTIRATGRVEILGTIDVRGGDSQGVISIQATSVPEVGAPGAAGGGRGGTGSPLTTTSSPRGGPGFAAFGVSGLGGQGGETGWTNENQQLDGRRGAGGGGGVFGANQAQSGAPELGTWEQSFVGLDVESGFANSEPQAQGALSGAPGPFGGASAPSPFVDSKSDNDFWGRALVGTQLIQGELDLPWAGAGGGAGGDAAFVPGGGTFPAFPFVPTGDEKGGPGGGGGGSLSIQAVGDIVFGSHGRILCRGGSGGGGENTFQTNRVGGGGGGGSGGHVVLQTAGVIDLSQSLGLGSVGSPLGTQIGGILATGGQGGAGKEDLGGAVFENGGKWDSEPQHDACPAGYPTAGENACGGHFDGAGGDGGPGLVQLHTPDGLASVLLPIGATLGDVSKPTPLFADGSGRLLPDFGKLSRAQSRWIALGEGGFVKQDGSHAPAAFTFGGTDPATGRVLGDGAGGVPLAPSILPAATLVAAPGLPSIAAPRTLALSAAGLDAEHAHLLANPAQLAGFVLRLSKGAASTRYAVASAEADVAAGVLWLSTDPDGPPLAGLHGLGDQVTLHPAWFRLRTDGIVDALPDSASVTLLFEATRADPLTGGPDLSAASGFTGDLAALGAAAAGGEPLRFVRFQVLFDMAASGGSPTAQSPRPALEFLRLPFRFD